MCIKLNCKANQSHVSENCGYTKDIFCCIKGAT